MSQVSNGRTVMVVGRIVWTCGDLFKGKLKTEFNSQKPKLNDQGEQMREYGFGLAVRKEDLQDPTRGAIWLAMHEEAYTLYPTRQLPPGFAMKYKDGDTAIDDQGVPYSTREGYAGHIVLSCTTSLPIKFFRHENGGNIMISEGIKCGDYVNVQLTVKGHPAMGQGKPGLYLNPNAVQFLGYGKEIVNTPNGDQIFGLNAPAMPAGASATPLAPNPGQMLMPQNPPMPMQPPQGYQQPMAPPPMQPQVPQGPTPHYGVVPQQFQPPQGGQPMPMNPPNAPGFAQSAGPGYPGASQGYPAPAPGVGAGMTPPNGMPVPTGYPQANAPTAAYPSNGMPPMPGAPQFRQ